MLAHHITDLPLRPVNSHDNPPYPRRHANSVCDLNFLTGDTGSSVNATTCTVVPPALHLDNRNKPSEFYVMQNFLGTVL